MPVTIEVLCRSNQIMTRQAIIDFVNGGAYFDEAPRFVPPAGSDDAVASAWIFLEIHYQPDKRPVQISHYANGTELTDIKQEASDQVIAMGLASPFPELEERLLTSRQAFVIEVGFVDVPEDCWEMIDALNAFLARTLDGVVHASDGFYDQDLQPIR